MSMAMKHMMKTMMNILMCARSADLAKRMRKCEFENDIWCGLDRSIVFFVKDFWILCKINGNCISAIEKSVLYINTKRSTN